MKNKLFTYSTFVLLLGFTACTQNDTGLSKDGTDGTPMSFSATGVEFPGTVSRATVEGDWNGVQHVAVKVGDEVKRYTVNSSDADDYETATLTSSTPFYWQNTNDIAVEAWWPCEENQTEMPAVKVKGDQSKVTDFYGSDFIYASSAALSYSNPTLHFNHRTARVTVTLTKGIGVECLDGATVTLDNLSTVDGNPGSILTCNSADTYTYDALLAPQTITEGTIFITVNLNGGEFEHITTTDINLVAGNRYNYSLKLNATGLEFVGVTIDEWTDVDSETEDVVLDGDADDQNMNIYRVSDAEGFRKWVDYVNAGNWSTGCVLECDIDLSAVTRGESNWTPIGTDEDNPFDGIFDGNNHTITGLKLNLSSEGCLGFFGYIGKYGTVKNLILEDVEIDGGSYAGALAGYNLGNIISCSASGNIQGVSDVHSSAVGGLIGSNSGNITACHFHGTVEGSVNAAGVTGINEGIVTACYAEGTVESAYTGGGVTGWTNYNLISCYFCGTVTGKRQSGGVVGYKSDFSSTGSNIISSYWSGNADKGIGGGTSGGVTKVEGSVTWETATISMNEALEDKNSEWRYVQGEDKTLPPTLQKNQ